MTDLENVVSRWDDNEWASGIPKDYWSHHPIINSYINSTIIPHAGDMLEWLAKNFMQDGPRERALSICCGLGVGDRQALAAGVCHSLEGFDVSPASIRTAQEEAAKVGLSERVHYWVDDVNTVVLEENRYDVALAFGAMHHVEALERLCDQLRQALKPNSYIFVNEFVGPPRLQWTEHQLEIINRVMAVLPLEWRRTHWVAPAPVEYMIATDPSEAVRSSEVVSVLCDNFDVVDYCDYGGALLMPLWGWGIIPDVFMEDKGIDKQVIIKLLILMDELVAERGIAPSNYVQLVLRNQPPVPGQAVSKRLSVNSPDRSRWVDQWWADQWVRRVLPAKSVTPWWRLPVRAFDILWYQGGDTLAKEIRSYLKWLKNSP